MKKTDYYVSYMNGIIDKENSSSLQDIWQKAINSIGTNPMCLAIQSGYKESVVFFLEQGISSEVICENALNPLYVAIINNRNNIAQILLEHGAKVESMNPGDYTPLQYATHYGNSYQVALLLKYGSEDIRAQGKTAAEIAAEYGHQDILKMLLSGLDVFCAQTDDAQYAEVCGKGITLETPVEI